MMNFDYQYVYKTPISIEAREVLRLQGFQGQLSQLKEETSRLLKSQIDLCYRLVQPRAVFRIFSSTISSEGKVRLDGSNEFSVGRATQEWTGLKYLAVAVCTIGVELEMEVSRLFNSGDFAAAVMLDSAGSVAVESMADRVNNMVYEQALSEKQTISCRISPGYGDWALEEQKNIFKLIPADKIGVTLTESCMMQPRKSVSLAIAIGENITTGKENDRCRYCGMTNCPYRVI